MADVSDDELFKLVVEADDEALGEGAPPKGRGILTIQKVMKRLGYQGYVLAGRGTPAIVHKIKAMHSSLYRPADLGMGGIHGGIFMFRDVFCRIYIPVMYGTVGLDPFTLTDMSQQQLRWLGSRPGDMHAFIDQFVDIFDFAGGIAPLGDFKTPPQEALELFWLAAFQLQAAAAILSVAFDFRGAIQSALIGAELALKAGLAAQGIDEAGRKKHGHNLQSAALAFATAHSGFDINLVEQTLSTMPAYVKNRYSPTQPNRQQTGHIVMGAQYVAAEVMRQLTLLSARTTMPEFAQRIYPSRTEDTPVESQ